MGVWDVTSLAAVELALLELRRRLLSPEAGGVDIPELVPDSSSTVR